ncbi:MAG: chromosome segregation protein SMC [Velocimicrobium sp.]
MYLKSIEVHGFKSFAHKLVFEFHNGITAIVGPNGSGKSNVADAVRWVLGEQSAKQLRGSKMEDVIFSGTELKRPQGFAYVAITLDNLDHKLATEYEEVTVARRVYRSGESEYLINGSHCRLRDVQELFLDTGIGKEGYSIIGQGQIDKILSGRPEERRELFDEAAGIVKFKKRKASAQKNLELEQQNLCRIHDILSELEKQIDPLEKQSLVAREYLGLRDELKQFDVTMFLMEYDRIHSDLQDIEAKSKIAEKDIEESRANYEATKEEYEKLEQTLTKLNVRLDEKKNDSSESKIKKEKLEGEVKVLNEQIIATRQNRDHYKERVAFVENEIKTKSKQLKEYQDKRDSMKHALSEINVGQKQEEEKFLALQEKIEENRKSIEIFNAEIIDSLNESATIKSRLQHFETILEQSNIKKAELNQRLLQNKSNELAFEANIEKKLESLLTISESIRVIQSNNEVFENDKRTMANELLQLQEEKNQSFREYHREQSQLDSLKNITERYDGYGQSIKRVMEQKKNNFGIIGVVADIIKVEKSYEVAIETALGGSIQNIVTDNEGTAKKLIEFLKHNKYGRATFLPLTTISNRGSFREPAVLTEVGVIGLASSLIQADKKFDTLMEYLLGKILVVDDMDHAIAIAKKYHQSIRMVTIEGDLINPGGSMSGGAYKNSSNLLSRRREMETLEEKIVENAEKIKILEKKEQKNQLEAKKLQAMIEENKGKLQEFFIEQNTAKMKYDQVLLEQNNNQLSLDEIKRENMELEGQARELKDAIRTLNETLQMNHERAKQNKSKIEISNQSMEEMKEVEVNQRRIVEELKLSYSTKEQSGQFIIENMERIQNEINKLSIDLEGLLDSMLDGNTQSMEREEAIATVRETVLEFDERIASLDKEISEIIKEKEEIEKDHKEFFSKRENLSLHMNELDKEGFRLNNQKEKFVEQLDNQINYMWEEYELTYSNAYSLKIETQLSYTQMKKLVGELKSRIRALGDVNVNAIEDYKSMFDRFNLLKTQHDDLIKSEEALTKIIGELDEEMRKQFSFKFQEIKKQFDLVFKEMFGGGKGTIELVEEEDILDAGIRIIAQPPGKKLQNMMQLSGGEKALTAISLLFAIQNLKPSPFCLLDEIEAALDDSNVSRFAKYLHKLTKDTQFIVITHRRGTMAAADRLYGITMQEKGVSTLVSVNLLEDDLEK